MNQWIGCSLLEGGCFRWKCISISGGEVAKNFFSQGAFNPHMIVLIPAIDGLITGFIVYKFAPEAEGHGTDEAIKALQQ